MKSLLILLSVPALFLCGCATDTGNAAKDARGRAANAALSEAGKVLGRIAVSALLNAAQQEAGGGRVDFASAASSGLWSNAGSIIDSRAIEHVITAYSADRLPMTAAVAAAAFDNARQSAGRQQRANAIAAVISTAAGAPPR